MSSRIWKGLISLWICFHLLTILVTPNRETYLGFKLSKALEPYANSLELAANWNFFAPQPGPPMRFEYEGVGTDGKQLAHEYWPPAGAPWRTVALSHFAMKAETGAERVVGNYFCRGVPGARSVRIWKNLYAVPDLLEVQAGRAKIGYDQLVTRTFVADWNCASGAQP